MHDFLGTSLGDLLSALGCAGSFFTVIFGLGGGPLLHLVVKCCYIL